MFLLSDWLIDLLGIVFKSFLDASCTVSSQDWHLEDVFMYSTVLVSSLSFVCFSGFSFCSLWSAFVLNDVDLSSSVYGVMLLDEES